MAGKPAPARIFKIALFINGYEIRNFYAVAKQLPGGFKYEKRYLFFRTFVLFRNFVETFALALLALNFSTLPAVSINFSLPV